MADKIELEEMLLNLKVGRYQLVGQARDWLAVVQRTDEGKTMSRAELIKRSLYDILSGKVTEEQIKTERAKIKDIPAPSPDEQHHGKY